MGVFGILDGFPGIILVFYISGYTGKLLKIRKETPELNVSQIILSNGFFTLDYYFWFFSLSVLSIAFFWTIFLAWRTTKLKRRNDSKREEIRLVIDQAQISHLASNISEIKN